MTYVVFFAILLLITLLGSYLVIENNRRKAVEAKKKLFNARVTEVTNNLKAKLNEFSDAKILRPKYIARTQVIASNFFVVQPHTDENLLYLEGIIESLISTISSELAKTYVTGERDALAEKLDYFVADLPQTGIAYNHGFYREILPSLIKILQSPELQNNDNEDYSNATEQTEITPPISPPKIDTQEINLA
ncbi:hypothetical protein HJP15_17145 [Pseudoalteromonas sp. NEC-BIFX-2020_002]|uniref:Uncharacterized protein n=1 Tax=Pseudoalteromonas porphyrae TaxID=187330 RepID=A0A0N0LWN8_9GAMM|nr:MULTISPECIES: hypothetical protein [Pseudoalteromonas]KPH59641.1 hypothetical protein ADS77_16790 [Pseudoalteromonas porphyrae]NMR27024.1 hypothetical protein [Pseudoalteromonas sp. NEC-BIFX-2020_015]NNG44623.1 hypothetical protein [Pseudoalteromonas sp. NEC-BIFX-2020_002]